MQIGHKKSRRDTKRDSIFGEFSRLLVAILQLRAASFSLCSFVFFCGKSVPLRALGASVVKTHPCIPCNPWFKEFPVPASCPSLRSLRSLWFNPFRGSQQFHLRLLA